MLQEVLNSHLFVKSSCVCNNMEARGLIKTPSLQDIWVHLQARLFYFEKKAPFSCMLFMRYSKDCSYFLRVPRFCKRKIIDTDGWAYLAACNVWSSRQMVYQINKWKKGGGQQGYICKRGEMGRLLNIKCTTLQQ